LSRGSEIAFDIFGSPSTATMAQLDRTREPGGLHLPVNPTLRHPKDSTHIADVEQREAGNAVKVGRSG
jgi:hypothetical protein